MIMLLVKGSLFFGKYQQFAQRLLFIARLLLQGHFQQQAFFN